MIQSANQKQQMKSVPHPLQICSKFFVSSNFGSGNKHCPANESMVCTHIIKCLLESTVNRSYLKRAHQCGCHKGKTVKLSSTQFLKHSVSFGQFIAQGLLQAADKYPFYQEFP